MNTGEDGMDFVARWPFRAITRERAGDDSVEIGRAFGADLRDERYLVREDGLQHLTGSVARQIGWPLACQTLVGDDPERPDIRARVDVRITEDLLGRHVVEGSDHDAGARQ
jgi:hypothetical protein